MAWKPITTAAELAAITVGTEESEMLDFKRDGYSGGQAGREIARDVAQFANAFGGTILIGADEADDKLTGLPGIPDAAKERSKVEKAAFANLEPRVAPDVRVIDRPGGDPVLAVNVPAFPGVVGVRVNAERWEFPVRRGTDRHYLTFGEAEKMLTQDRRGRLLIESIPEASWSRITVDAYLRKIPRGGWTLKTLETHCVVLACPGNQHIEIPYSFIKAVWPSGGDRFTISMDVAITRVSSPSGPTGPYHDQFVVQGLREGAQPPLPEWEINE